jgi:hypothetical protein
MRKSASMYINKNYCTNESTNVAPSSNSYTTSFDSYLSEDNTETIIFPQNTKEVIFNNKSNCVFEIVTSVGKQTCLENGTVGFQVNDTEDGIIFQSLNLISGSFVIDSDTILYNYRIATI